MSQSARLIAFRCTTCWHETCAPEHAMGGETPCVACGATVTVPEPTPENLERGRNFQAEQAAQQQAVAQVEAAKKPASAYTRPTMHYASRIKRLVGVLIDAAAMFAAGFVGLVLAHFYEPINFAETGSSDMSSTQAILILFPVFALVLVQWMLTAESGRTLGKYAMFTKVVLENGEPPGFLRGVVMRYWVTALLGWVPFFALADNVWILFHPEKRCLHDLLAGTWVVDA
ncbi:MAG: RDD family protein [Planctomycetota bacterium]